MRRPRRWSGTWIIHTPPSVLGRRCGSSSSTGRRNGGGRRSTSRALSCARVPRSLASMSTSMRQCLVPVLRLLLVIPQLLPLRHHLFILYLLLLLRRPPGTRGRTTTTRRRCARASTSAPARPLATGAGALRMARRLVSAGFVLPVHMVVVALALTRTSLRRRRISDVSEQGTSLVRGTWQQGPAPRGRGRE